MWKDSSKKLPNIGDAVLVKTLSGQVFYAVYSDIDEFDVHRFTGMSKYRECWFKYSGRTVVAWRYFAKK